jgi:hypothetical protein
MTNLRMSKTNSMEQTPLGSWQWFTKSDNFLIFYETRRFITALTRTCHGTLSGSTLNQTHPNTLFVLQLSSIILFSQLHLSLQSSPFPSGISTKNLYPIITSPFLAPCSQIRPTYRAYFLGAILCFTPVQRNIGLILEC